MRSYYSNGKLLLTGEYVVLDGAKALALPTKFGQTLTVEEIDEPKLFWKSLDQKGDVWLNKELSVDQIVKSFTDSSDEVLIRLFQILISAKQLNPNFLNSSGGFSITTKLDFQRDWGLGSSSTLINNVANWAMIDPYDLLKLTFDGSGYDIACAQYDSPITYQLIENSRNIEVVSFNPKFSDCLYFVHLNQKRNSSDAIKAYQNKKIDFVSIISDITSLTNEILNCRIFSTFCNIIDKHEVLISEIIKEQPIKEVLFSDFNGSIKSLGAWGGDFVLVASNENPFDYFSRKGFSTIIPYNDMVLY